MRSTESSREIQFKTQATSAKSKNCQPPRFVLVFHGIYSLRFAFSVVRKKCIPPNDGGLYNGDLPWQNTQQINLNKHKFMSAGSNFVVTWVEFACPTLCAEPFFLSTTTSQFDQFFLFSLAFSQRVPFQ